jgi:hypothetical protein
MTAQRRKRLLLGLAGLAVASLLLDRLVLGPLTRHWDRRSSELATLGRSLAAGRGVVEREERTRQLWKEIESGALPEDRATAEQRVLAAFDAWGQATRIEVASIKPAWKRGSNSRYSLLECRVDATGSLESLARLLFEVEQSPLALRVESVELTARDEQGQRLSLALVVSGLRLFPLEVRP